MADKAKILVVDDEETMLDSCHQVLAREGYEVEEAQDGSSGLAKVENKKPDLVLVDLKMPGINGLDVLEKIKNVDQEIITVVITGYATVESAVEAMKRGAYDFLPKPFTPNELRLIVKRGLEKRRLALEALSLRQEKEKMKENFITMVSHQLKTPLVDVEQYFEVILGEMVGKINPEQRKILKKIKTSIENLLTLINHWLDMSRMERGRIIENLEPLKLTPLLDEVIEQMGQEAKSRKVTLKLDTSSPLPLVQAERESIKQVFINLIHNGINYNREGGRVLVKAKEIKDYVMVEISDTGVGISQENIPFIFGEFFRVKNKKTRDTPGTGLGLSIVKRIVEAHSGFIKVRSKSGKGSTFSIFLPRFKKKKDNKKSRRQDHANSKVA